MQGFYDTILSQNLNLIKISKSDFSRNFSNEYDASKRTKYLISLSKEAAGLISTLNDSNRKDWKESIYYQEMDVQSLKLRFGRITFTISENINRYSDLIKKYKNDPDIGFKVIALENKLDELKVAFDGTFDPLEYINSAIRMKKIN